MLHPLGEDFDNLECNYIIDKNLITGLTIVDNGGQAYPTPKKDAFWDVSEGIAPLYSFDTAHRTVSPMTGSVADLNFVKNVKEIFMIPHKSKLICMSDEEQLNSFQKVDVSSFNESDNRNKKKKQYGIIDKNQMRLKHNYNSINNNDLKQIAVKTPLLSSNN